jgi:hypothetical protein
MDSQYAADSAVLRSNIAKQYQDVLQQLGYTDPDTGQFIMGSVESEAKRQQADLQRSLGLADESVTQQHQGLGTLFSGLRGTDQARAEYPFVNSMSQLATQTPLTLSQLYEQGAGLIDSYNLQNNQLLAGAAQRAAAAINQAPPAAGGPAPAPAAPAAPADPNADILALAAAHMPAFGQTQAGDPNFKPAPQLRGTAGITGVPSNPGAGGYYDPRTSRYVQTRGI